MIDAIIEYLYRSGYTPQSVESLRPDLPRWVRRLWARGIAEVPSLPVTEQRSWDPVDAAADNEHDLLMLQAAPDDARDEVLAHHLRNLTRVETQTLAAARLPVRRTPGQLPGHGSGSWTVV